MAAVGRDRELRIIDAFLGRDPDRGRMLLLRGEPGIGKTTLWREGVALARARDRTVLSCAAAATETQLGFTALRDLLGERFSDVAGTLPGPQRRALDVTLLREEPGDAPPEPGAIAVAFLSALRAFAEQRPTLVAIDDLQWLDTASASTIAYALRRLDHERIAFLVSCRPGADAALGLDPQDPSLETIEVGLLSVGALGRVLRMRLDAVYPRPTLQRLHTTANGNPLHALELARALGQSTQPLPPDAPLPVPAALRDLVRDRLAALPEGSGELLAFASALPRPELAVVAAAFGGDPTSALHWALEAQVVELEDGRIRFTHPLYAAAVYELASPRRRAEIHARLAPLVDDPEQRARHEALAADVADERVAGVVEHGARLAHARGSPEAAAELAAHAVRLTPTNEAVARERRALAQADYLFASGDTAQADAIVAELLRSAASGPTRAGLLSRRARIEHFRADIASSVARLEQALAQVGTDDALRGEIEEGLAWGLLLLRRDLPGAAEHARSAVVLAEARADSRALAEALAALAVTEFVLGRPWETTMRQALELEPHMAGTRVLRHPSFAFGYCLSCSDRLNEARETFQALRTRADEHGDEGSMPSLLNHLTLVELLAGNWPTAAAFGDDCLVRALGSGQQPTQASVLGKLALLAVRRGRIDEAREHAGRSLEIASGGSFDPSRPEQAMSRGGETAIWTIGLLELSLDDPEQAHHWLAPLVRSLLDAGVEEPGEIRCLPDEVEALVALGSKTEAAALVDRLEGWAERVGRPSVRASAGRSRALLLASDGDADGALVSLEAAAAVAERSQLPFERARTLLGLGALERRARRRRAARESLGVAIAIFEELGSDLWAERARSELGRIGGRAPTADGLTPTEQRIAGLVAEGKSNKEVAAALVVSVHTVESVLTSVYRKLDVRSRTELARKLAVGGWNKD